ncbi:hypothetical protein HZB00_02650, partial [Candidatus Woesearchaeota archaeon]|nr:hypothetical protein [Candidatus Woesearchaeota archaeon]
ELTKEEVWDWIRGFDLEKTVEGDGFMLLTYNGDVLGVGNAKDGRILNTIPKERRIKNLKKG